MPPKKKTTEDVKDNELCLEQKNNRKTVNNVHKKNPELCKVIKSYVVAQQNFIDACKDMEKYNEDTMYDLDLQIDNKKEEYNELDKQLKREYEEKLYDLEKNFLAKQDDCVREYQKMKDDYKRMMQKEAHEGSIKTLKEFGEVPVKETELNEMKKKLSTLEEEHKKELSKEKAILENQHKRDLETRLKTMELEHERNMAITKAENEQRLKEIENLNATILRMSEEIKEQRQLTKQVAEASKQGAITQNYGK